MNFFMRCGPTDFDRMSAGHLTMFLGHCCAEGVSCGCEAKCSSTSPWTFIDMHQRRDIDTALHGMSTVMPAGKGIRRCACGSTCGCMARLFLLSCGDVPARCPRTTTRPTRSQCRCCGVCACRWQQPCTAGIGRARLRQDQQRRYVSAHVVARVTRPATSLWGGGRAASPRASTSCPPRMPAALEDDVLRSVPLRPTLPHAVVQRHEGVVAPDELADIVGAAARGVEGQGPHQAAREGDREGHAAVPAGGT